MSSGPVELLVVKFPGNQFRGGIAPALKELVGAGTIRVIDLMFAMKDEQGNVSAIEFNELEDDVYDELDSLVDDLNGTLSQDDAVQIGATLENNSSVALLLFENTWVRKFKDAVMASNGELVLDERIPGRVVDELLAYQSADNQPMA